LKTQLFSGLVESLEIPSVIFLLLFAEVLNISASVVNVVNFISYGIVALLVIRRWKQVTYVATRDISLMLLVGVALTSIFWSDNLGDTISNLRGLIRSTIFGAYLATRYSPKEQMRLLSWTIGIAIILSIAVSLALPSYGTHHINHTIAWQGIYAHKQYLGRIMALGASVFLVTAFDKQSNHWVALTGLCLVCTLILASKSSTGLIIFVFSILLMPLYKILKQPNKLRVVLLIIALLLFMSLAIVILMNLETIVVDLLGKDLEFNGRTPIWNLAIEMGLEQPWLGYGYAAFWDSDAGKYIIDNTWAFQADTSRGFHSHNGFLQLFLELGFIGLLLFIINFLLVFKRVFFLFVSTKKNVFFWMFEFLVIKIVFNMSEQITILSPSNIYWIIYVSIALSSIVEYNKIRQNSI